MCSETLKSIKLADCVMWLLHVIHPAPGTLSNTHIRRISARRRLPASTDWRQTACPGSLETGGRGGTWSLRRRGGRWCGHERGPEPLSEGGTNYRQQEAVLFVLWPTLFLECHKVTTECIWFFIFWFFSTSKELIKNSNFSLYTFIDTSKLFSHTSSLAL